MKILALSDEECPALWEYYTPGRLDGYDLILACGDLNANYLSFIVTMAKCPVLYVAGNHDVRYQMNPPQGCDPIDDHFVVYNGIRIIGLGGCLDVYAGNVERAPEAWQKAGMEWAYRLKKEPKRITRMAKLPLVLVKSAGQRVKGKKA